MCKFISLLLIGFLLSLPARASLNFLFTITGPSGNITGEIYGLANSGASIPTEITIFTQPAGYPLSAPISLIVSGFGFYPGDNKFTVTAGNITAADVGIYKGVAGGDYQGYAFDLNDSSIGYANANGLYLTNAGGGIIKSNANTLGFIGATYTAVPEPRDAMAIFLFAAMSLIMARKILKPSPKTIRLHANTVF